MIEALTLLVGVMLLAATAWCPPRATRLLGGLLFGIVVGIALLLTGTGLLILALAVLGGGFREEAAAQAGVATKVAIGH